MIGWNFRGMGRRWVMWKALWKKWTVDKPPVFGDLLWDVLVVQLAAFLDRLTLRRVIALIPAVILFLANFHSIPIPPELMLVGDFLAYIDVFSVLFLIGILSRATTILFIIKQVSERAAKLTSGLVTEARRLGFRRERETDGRKRPVHRLKDDDEPAIVAGAALARIAWARRRIAGALDSVSDAVIQTTPHVVNA
jgi:hypothetical protein